VIKKLLLPVLLILAAAGGVVGADVVKTRALGEVGVGAHLSEPETNDASQSKPKAKDRAKDKGSHAKASDGGGYGGPAYLKFKRQFVVPVMQSDEISALVIMNINLELADGAPEAIYSFEPKLRDALIREMMILSGEGLLGRDLTQPESYETIRKNLLVAAQDVLPEAISNILILDIVRQDQ